MNRKVLIFGIIALLFVACKSKEEKVNELIKAELYKTLYDFQSYEPIETIVDSAFTSIYRDTTIVSQAYLLEACIDKGNEYIEEAKDAISSMEIWGDSYSSYGRSKYYDAKEKFNTNLESAKFYQQKIEEITLIMKEDIDKFKPSFCGFQAKHKFRCKTKGGNFTIGNYLYIIDEKFKTILSVSDLDDEDEVKIKKLIDEAKGYEQELNIEMVFVRGGTFTMGCNNCDSDEKPTHQVTLSDFYIGKHEVTQEQWKAVMGSNPSYFSGSNLPVEQVSWNSIVGTSGTVAYTINGVNYRTDGFCYKLSQAVGGGVQYRLPTEAEWEYAAKGGQQTHNYTYSGSNTLNGVAWYFDNSGKTTHAVGSKAPNELGIYDMSGNVREWCSDWYGSYSSSSQTNPTGASSGSLRVLRGGGWYAYGDYCRVSDRSGTPDLGSGNNGSGFRLACSSK